MLIQRCGFVKRHLSLAQGVEPHTVVAKLESMRNTSLRAVVAIAVTLVLAVVSLARGGVTSQAAPLRQGTPQPTPTSTSTATPTPGAAADFSWTRVPTNQIGATAGSSVTISGLQLTYQGSASSTSDESAEFLITVDNLPRGANPSISPNPQFPLRRNTPRDLLVLVSLPNSTPAGTIVLRVTAVKIAVIAANGTRQVLTPEQSTQAVAFITLVIAGGSPTVTPGTCPEVRDPGNSFKDAAQLRVDLEESHGICRTGDEDWFRFAGVGGKRYTIDIVSVDAGLDLALQLFDEKRNLLDANDDFPLRDPAKPDFTDTRPRINAFLVPRNGTYFIRVYDSLGIGGSNLTYKIIVRSEGFNDPPIIPSVCNDRFEPDGLAEQAQTILGNGRHDGHRLCPAGDADWVKFFASRELVYYLYTDTTPPSGGKQPGADTVIYFFSRDGVTLLDSNNNRGIDSSLDSLIVFQPEADGIYYAQIKNIGDIGGNLITYNLILDACVSQEVNCGPKGAQSPAGTGTPTAAPASSPEASVPEFFLDPTPTP